MTREGERPTVAPLERERDRLAVWGDAREGVGARGELEPVEREAIREGAPGSGVWGVSGAHPSLDREPKEERANPAQRLSRCRDERNGLGEAFGQGGLALRQLLS